MYASGSVGDRHPQLLFCNGIVSISEHGGSTDIGNCTDMKITLEALYEKDI